MTTQIAHALKDGEAPAFYLTEDHHPEGSTMLGFWIYLMSDCLIFAVLFATYAVLGRNYAAGPSPADLFDLPIVAINTAMLLFSSITYGFAMLQMEKNTKAETLFWLAITGLFGAAFLGLRTLRILPPDPWKAPARRAAPSCRPSSRWSARTACTSPSASSG